MTSWSCVICAEPVTPPVDLAHDGMVAPGEPGWAAPVVRRMALLALDLAARWRSAPVTDADRAAVMEPVAQRDRALRAVLVDDRSTDADLLLLVQWLVQAAYASPLAAQFAQERTLSAAARLHVVDGEVVYARPRLGVGTDVALLVASTLGGGIAGNTSYDLLKHAIAAFRRRVAAGRASDDDDGMAQTPLSRSEALEVAVGVIVGQWPEFAGRIRHAKVRSEQRTTHGVWRFVLESDDGTFTAFVPPGVPRYDAVEVHHTRD